MSASAQMAKRVRVAIKQGDRGVLVATSPDLKGLLVVSKSRDILMSEVSQAISDLYRSCGQPVVVVRLDEPASDDDVLPWVTMPAEVARQQLER